MPAGYDGAAYARDVETFLNVVDHVTPGLRIAGPGATADVVPLVISRSSTKMASSPRPDYWAAVLWARLMGPGVLTPTGSAGEDLTVYAHCRAGDEPGIAYAAINTSTDQTRTATTASGTAEVYLLTGDDLDGGTIKLNGTELAARDDGTLPDHAPERTDGTVEIPPASVAFVVDPDADAPACA